MTLFVQNDKNSFHIKDEFVAGSGCVQIGIYDTKIIIFKPRKVLFKCKNIVLRYFVLIMKLSDVKNN